MLLIGTRQRGQGLAACNANPSVSGTAVGAISGTSRHLQLSAQRFHAVLLCHGTMSARMLRPNGRTHARRLGYQPCIRSCIIRFMITSCNSSWALIASPSKTKCCSVKVPMTKTMMMWWRQMKHPSYSQDAQLTGSECLLLYT